MDTKIVSISTAASAIVCALGFEKHIAEFSPTIDFFSELLANWDLVNELAPDYVITEFEAETFKEVQIDEANSRHNTKIISINANSLAGIYEAIKTIAGVLSVLEKGEQLIEGMQERVDIIRHKLKYTENKPRICCIAGLDPVNFSKGLIPEMVTLAGGTSVPVLPVGFSFEVEKEDLSTLDPDILILMPPVYSIDRTLKEMNSLINRGEFANLSAVKNNRVYIIDGEQSFNKPGPHIIDSIEILAEIINPKQFSFGYEGIDWVKFSF